VHLEPHIFAERTLGKEKKGTDTRSDSRLADEPLARTTTTGLTTTIVSLSSKSKNAERREGSVAADRENGAQRGGVATSNAVKPVSDVKMVG